MLNLLRKRKYIKCQLRWTTGWFWTLIVNCIFLFFPGYTQLVQDSGVTQPERLKIVQDNIIFEDISPETMAGIQVCPLVTYQWFEIIWSTSVAFQWALELLIEIPLRPKLNKNFWSLKLLKLLNWNFWSLKFEGPKREACFLNVFLPACVNGFVWKIEFKDKILEVSK